MRAPFLCTVLDALDIPYNLDFVKKLSESEPFGNSLFGLSLMLRRYRVPNECVKFDYKNTILKRGREPFVVIYKGMFVVAKFDNNSYVSLKWQSGSLSTVKIE